MALPETAKPFRLVFVSESLSQPVRISGTTRVDVSVKVGTKSTPLSALLVDYGPSQVIPPRSFSFGEIFNMSCTLENIRQQTGCAAPSPFKAEAVTALIVTRGTIDVKNRNSLSKGEELTPGETYQVQWELHPKDYIFAAGHRMGVVINANYKDYAFIDEAAGAATLNLERSRILLPISSGLNR